MKPGLSCNYCTPPFLLMPTISYPADPDHRLVLLYLTNDILQNGRRKGADMFNDLFREHLEQVVPSIW